MFGYVLRSFEGTDSDTCLDARKTHMIVCVPFAGNKLT